jgi:transposase-like protein
MKIHEFSQRFPDETSCKLHFKSVRENEGIICKKCSSTRHYWLRGKWQWQCTSCGFRTTLRSGTIMESAKLSFYKWYLCMAYMIGTKKGISATEMQRQLGHKRYRTVWVLMHKIRSGMGKRDCKYVLEGTIELDEGYFEVATPSDTVLKRGRGSQSKKNVSVMAESTPLEDLKSGKKSSHFRYAKMKVLDSHESTDINKVVSENIESQALIITDKSTSYEDFSALFDTHVSFKSDAKTTKTTLKWVHITISNAKRNLLGVYHMMNRKYLQSYLNEFCYRLNRRYFGERLFDRMTIAIVGN